MPFESQKQIAACFANMKRNPNTTWDCHEWYRKTKNPHCLPKRKGGPLPRGCKKAKPRKTNVRKKKNKQT